MVNRTSITCHISTFDRLNDRRHDGESWDSYLNRLADAAESTDDAANSNEFTPDDIDDVADTIARRTADEIETRLR